MKSDTIKTINPRYAGASPEDVASALRRRVESKQQNRPPASPVPRTEKEEFRR